MPISDFAPAKTVIELNSKPLMEVRGLSLEDVSRLIRDHLDDLNRIVEMQSGSMKDIYTRMNADGMLLKVLTDIPQVCAEAIAMAADDYNADNVRTVRSMPMALQLKAMQAILKLTMEDIGGPKGLSALFKSLQATY